MRNALLIEDSAEYPRLVRAALAESFRVHTANDREAAIKALKQNSFDLISIDVGLPGRNGLVLFEELRQDIRLKSVRIFL